jgi:hypothetical protein
VLAPSDTELVVNIQNGQTESETVLYEKPLTKAQSNQWAMEVELHAERDKGPEGPFL